MGSETDTTAYTSTRTGVGGEARSVAVRWFLIGKFAMLTILAVTYHFTQSFIVETVTTAPWQLSGLTFVAIVAVVGAPALAVGGGCMLYGVVKAVRIDTQ